MTKHVYTVKGKERSKPTFSHVLVSMMLLVPFLAPAYIGLAYPVLNAAVNVWQIASLSILVISYAWKRLSLPVSALYLSAAYLPIVFSTMLNSGDVKTAIFQYAYAMGIAGSIEYSLKTYGNSATIRALMSIFELLIYTNLISMLLWPKGLYHTSYLGAQLGGLSVDNGIDRVGWLLGHQSLCGCYSIIGISIAALYSYCSYGSKSVRPRSLVLILACVVQCVLSGSGMNMLSIAVLLCLILMARAGFRQFLRNYKFILVLCVVATLCAVYSGVLDVFAPWIESTFNRSSDLSGRVPVWAYALELFARRPILGFGIEHESSSLLLAINNVTHAHNQYIQALLSGGLIGLLGMLACLVLFLKKARKVLPEPMLRIIALCCYVTLVLMLTDVYLFRHPVIVVPYLLCFVADQALSERNEDSGFAEESSKKGARNRVHSRLQVPVRGKR